MRTLLGLVVLALLGGPAPAAAADAPGGPQMTIGFLLMAIDVQRDHIRVSEALRISNAGPPRDVEMAFTLPPASRYVTFHRGLVAPKETPQGFADRVHLPTGISEVVYSYSLATGSREALHRVFPLRVQRLEIAVRGGRRLRAMQGQPLPPLGVGPQVVQRWEVRGLPEGESVTLVLDGLPVSRPWVPAAAALGLAVTLAAGLVVGLRRNPTTQDVGTLKR